ncbi:MAG: methionine--tRNA ligase [Balneolaceae bacterium]|nr:methionine--tRNA ligase [Balneolaceae bacterium]
MKRTLVTSALPYANGPLHLGHLAGAYLPADLFVRYRRMRGDDILHICGSDEHGVPITLAAEKEGVAPQDIVDRFHEMNKKSFAEFGIDFDYYGRTSSKVHYETSRAFFTNLHEKGVFREKVEEQLYDEEAEMFLPDRYVKGTCPNCGYEEAYGDQCEKCGSSLSPTELIDPRSALTGKVPQTRTTRHWYLPLGDFQERLENWLESRTNWKANVRGQVQSWLNEGLADRAVTRDLTWGVPVPLEEADGKVLYVWFDAPIGYISATKEWAAGTGDPEAWKRYWQDEETELLHFIGKDNIVFHCIMFPAMLMAHGDYVLPENVPANEFLNLESRKLSTSRGWAVWLRDYLEDFEADLLRYVLGTILPESKDSDFTWGDFQNKVNSELADVLGNFAHRTLSFTLNYFDGKVPPLEEPAEADRDMLSRIAAQRERIAECYEAFRLREAIAETMKLARAGNKYFTDREPWHTRKSDRQTCGNTLHVCLQVTAALSSLFDPVMPAKMGELRRQLGLGEALPWQEIGPAILSAGEPVREGEILFEKIEDTAIEVQLEKLRARSGEDGDAEAEPETEDYEPLKERISYDEFARLDMRAARILSAEPVEDADRLLKLRVDLGFEERTVVAGIAGHYRPDELEGRMVCVLANLEPRTLFGIESNGMVLMAEESDGGLKFLSADAHPGSTVA